jgi:hypothetical protein
MSYWEGPARWINTILLVIIGFVGFDTLFRLLQAREENAIVGVVRSAATVFLAPFEGMFEEQEYLMTAIIAVLGYCLLAAIVLAVVRSIQSSMPATVREVRGEVPPTRSVRPTTTVTPRPAPTATPRPRPASTPAPSTRATTQRVDRREAEQTQRL